ncbi:hypothetical protein F4779DRAFT_609148 [Xylariaceae sp. FL0662B]|nr:hypothetical protein F4779DRAFT_609148 [Xylariaceae sp. FL0662B]
MVPLCLDPVEIVAPIMLFNPAGAWRKEVEYMFRNISPGAGDWGTAELKSICKAIIYFECAFEVLFPKSRRGNQWAKSNRFDNRNFSSLSGQRCFELIDACHNPVEVADLMSPDRYYAWNFDNLYFGRKATIEFRRPPGVNNPDVCLAWMELTISFVQAARRHSIGGMLSKYSPDIAGLRRFVNGGLIMGISNSHLFDSIFQGKSGALQPQQVQIINKNMLMKKRKEDKRKNVMMKKLGQLSSLS